MMMMGIKNCMLAVAPKKPLALPLYVSPKYDGIRATVQNGTLWSRSNKSIPNEFCQQLFGIPELEGLDGELIVGSPTAKDVFQKTTSGVMSVDGEPDVYFFAFDAISELTFEKRYFALEKAQSSGYFDHMPRVILTHHVLCETENQLESIESRFLNEGYEGAICRKPDGRYKHGRSTEREGFLLKLKRFMDAEAVVEGVVEMMHNDNPAYVSETGRTMRSTAAEGLRGAGVLGALQVADLTTGEQFQIGSGFTAAQRAELWGQNLIGKIVKYKHFPIGRKDVPRFPTFIGFRDERDL